MCQNSYKKNQVQKSQFKALQLRSSLCNKKSVTTFLIQSFHGIIACFLHLLFLPSSVSSKTTSTQSSETQVDVELSSTSITQSMQMLNHAFPIKLDKNNSILQRTQMENVIFANGFEDHIEGLKLCPSKTANNGETNSRFILWQ